MSGYIGVLPVPQTTQTRESFTATNGQTSFGTSGYQIDHLDVYLNGVKLAAADFTATNGSDIVLATGAALNDILEMVAFETFTIANQSFTGTTTVDTLVVTNTVDGRDVSVDGAKLDTIPIVSTSSTPSFTAKGDGSSQDGYIQLNCSQNSHGIKLKAPPHSANASYTLTFPNDDGNANQFLKTDGSGVLSWATDSTTDSTKLPLAGGAMTGAITTNSTFDGVDVATRDAVLTSTTTTAGAALPKAGGALTGAVTTNSTFDGRDVSADGVTADAALPKAGGAMTGAITTNSTFDGVDIATRDAVLTSTTTTANAALPKAGGTMTGNLTAPNLVASGSLSLNDGTDNFNIGVTTNRLTIKSTTSDGSDDTSILIDAGSAGESSSRGSYIEVHGNETSQDAGKVIYQMGNVSGSTHDFRKAGGTTAALITSSGYVGIGATNPDSPVTIQPAAQGIGTNSVQSWMYALSSGSEFDLKLNQVVSSGLVKYAFTLRNNGTSYANNLVLDRGNVGIGTTALESWKLNVAGTNFSSGGGLAVAAFRDLRSYNTSDNGGGIAFQGIYNSGGGYTNFATIQAGKLNNTDGDYSTYLRFLTRNNGASQAERMRIDNSGNVLVANTTGASSNTGHIFAPTGIAFHVRNGGVPLVVDRLTNDGDLQLFRKGGVTVGRIASRSSVTSTIILDPRTNGAGLSGTTNAILPTNNAGVLTNAATSLGITGGAFKDLHLSGGVVFGPASASNVSSQTLDSYEEGNASSLGLPSDGTGFTSSGATFAGAKYVKIGALVNVRFSVTFAGTSGNWTAGDGFYITGMPFTNNSIRSSGSCWASASWTAGNRVSGIAMAYNNSTAYVGIEYGSGVSRSTILYCSVTFNNT